MSKKEIKVLIGNIPDYTKAIEPNLKDTNQLIMVSTPPAKWSSSLRVIQSIPRNNKDKNND